VAHFHVASVKKCSYNWKIRDERSTGGKMVNPLLGCYGIRHQINILQAQIQYERNRLTVASPGEKPYIANRINSLSTKLADLNEALMSCNEIVRVLAVRVSDDDGSRTANISPIQVNQWVVEANKVFESPGIHFMFQPSEDGPDWLDVQHTAMNDIFEENQWDDTWISAKEFGNELAANHSKKMAVFFRHGPGPTPSGGGFSSTSYNFVVMPGFNETQVCGSQNIGLFAHEVGHYFGLHHTHAKIFDTIAEAEADFEANGSDPKVFNGDGIADTPPEPFIRDEQCTMTESVTLKGHTFSLLRTNNMSYYYSPSTSTHTPEQGAVLRSWVQKRFPNGPDVMLGYVVLNT
jgi:hypothetical protein